MNAGLVKKVGMQMDDWALVNGPAARNVLDYCPLCGDLMECLEDGPKGQPRRKCCAGDVVFIQSRMYRVEVESTGPTVAAGEPESRG